jgi:hypothetical protein
MKFQKIIIKNLAVMALLSTAAFHFTGCATPANPDAMSASKTDFGRRHQGSVAINVSGGTETDPTGKSQISDANFAAAIKASIEKSGVFAKVLGADAADYRLDAGIVRVSQPTAGFNMTVELEVSWTLARRSDGRIAWQKAEISTHTAKVSDAFAGVARLRMATEGAARLNIEQALGEIGKLDIR